LIAPGVIRIERAARRGDQRGLSLLGLLVFGAIVVFVAMIALKVFPTYTEYLAIQRAVQTAREQPNPAAIRSAFDRAAAIDDITSINGRDLEIAPAPGGGHHVAFGYEKRVPLFGPASLLIDYRGDTRSGR
jgi:hypothetical protein